MNIGTLLSASAVRNPRKTATAFENENIPYEQLDCSATLLARWVLQQGCKPGDSVAIHWPNSIEAVKLLFACLKAGLIAVPVNVRSKAPEAAYILAHSKAEMCSVHPDLIMVAKETYGTSQLSLQSSPQDLNDHDQDTTLPDVSDRDPALILYASGTTARPEGVTHTHEMLLEAVSLMRGAVSDSFETAGKVLRRTLRDALPGRNDLTLVPDRTDERVTRLYDREFSRP